MSFFLTLQRDSKNKRPISFAMYEVHIVQKAVYIWKRFEYNKNIS